MDHPRSSRLLLLSALLGAVLIVHRPYRYAALTVLRLPFTVVKGGVGILVALPQLPTLSRENAALRSELMQRQLESAQLREALRQSQQAQTLLSAVHATESQVAAVIGRSTLPTQQLVLLDRGSHQGLTREGIIVDATGVIGRIIEVHPATSLVMLLTDPESRVAAIVERSRETGLLVGQGQGRGEFIYLDVHADIEEGDRVVTAGLGGPFPKGLLLGTVVKVMRDEQSGAASAWVSPAARLGRLEEVLCLPPSHRVAEDVEGGLSKSLR